jgi:hypothetical protein
MTLNQKIHQQLLVLYKRMAMLYEQGSYQEAVAICMEMSRLDPESADPWGNAAAICLFVGRWQDALSYGQIALARGCSKFELYDTLAHAYCQLGQWDQARRFGLQSLNMRAIEFSKDPVIPAPEHGAPAHPLPSAQTRERNIIAFSLFGRASKYCEPAILNVQEQPRIYPHWVCRFYVDGSVPDNVIARLAKGGAQIVPVDGPAALWPGPMWRLLALDDALAHRVLLRDADAVISRREAAAVEQWLASGKRFHMMRDWGSHTELIMAGLWGVVSGSLPPLRQRMDRFMSAPLESRHFADQYFLRQYVWPYARASLMQHDSVFGFMDAAAFPEGERSEDFHVGCADAARRLGFKSDQPDGSEVTWALFRIEKHDDGKNREELICSYTNTVHNGAVEAHMPKRYMQWIKQGTACVRQIKNNVT